MDALSGWIYCRGRDTVVGAETLSGWMHCQGRHCCWGRNTEGRCTVRAVLGQMLYLGGYTVRAEIGEVSGPKKVN